MNDRGQATTLEEIEAIPKNTLTPEDVAGYIGCNPYNINLSVKVGSIPWAYQIGNRTVIPKEAFLRFHRYGKMDVIESGLYTESVKKAAQLILREEMKTYLEERELRYLKV